MGEQRKVYENGILVEDIDTRTPDEITQETLNRVYYQRTASLADNGYGTLGEQLDMIYHNGIEAWQTHIAAVKVAYPKPEA